MKYILKIGSQSKFPEIEIDKDRFLNLKLSREVLGEALAIEEKYEILIYNYLDLEKESLRVSVTQMVRDNVGYVDLFDIRLALDIRLINLMTSVRLYTDQLSSHLSNCLPNDADIKRQAKQLFSDEYDKSFDYRFMEALRNYVQHSGTPVHRVTTGSGLTDLNNGLLEYSLYFATQKKHLNEDGKFKNKVLEEMPKEVNLLLATRSYIESISTVHHQARELIRKNVTRARALIEASINDYKSMNKEHSAGLHAYAIQKKEIIEKVPIFLQWDDIRLHLENRNKKLSNLKKRYATGQAYTKLSKQAQ